MGRIMIRCPATQRVIATGMEMDTAQFRQATVFFSRSYCPHCSSHHEWFAKEAWVEDLSLRGSAEAA